MSSPTLLKNIDVLSSVCNFLGCVDISNLRQTCIETTSTSRCVYQLVDRYIDDHVPKSFSPNDYKKFVRQTPTPPKINVVMIVDESNKDLTIYNCCVNIL